MSVFGVILVCIFPHSDWIEILRISPYSVQVRENADQINSEYGHFMQCLLILETKINNDPLSDSQCIISIIHVSTLFIQRYVWSPTSAISTSTHKSSHARTHARTRSLAPSMIFIWTFTPAHDHYLVIWVWIFFHNLACSCAVKLQIKLCGDCNFHFCLHQQKIVYSYQV